MSETLRLMARYDLAGPVLVTAVVILALVGARLVQYDGDPTGFVQFGQIAAPAVGAPGDARVGSEIGYDGQFFYVQALDPLLRGRARSALVATDGEYRVSGCCTRRSPTCRPPYGGDHWNYTRLAAPLMAALVVLGLDQRERAALAVPALAAFLTLLIPVAFSAGAGA